MSKFNFEGKCLLKSTDYSKDELNYIIDKAQQLKAEKKNNQSHQLLTNKNIAIIFEKPSTLISYRGVIRRQYEYCGTRISLAGIACGSDG